VATLGTISARFRYNLKAIPYNTQVLTADRAGGFVIGRISHLHFGSG
jgi:hypothetical protein